MGARRLKLRHHATCADCSRPLAKGVEATWDPAAKLISCLACTAGSDGAGGGRWPLGPGRRTLVAGSGVWLVDARRYMGLISVVDAGRSFRAEPRLHVGGRDRTDLVEALARRVHRLRLAIDCGPDAGVPVHGALCFVDADFRLASEPVEVLGVTVTWVRALAERLSRPGPVDIEQRLRLHADLVRAFPSSSVVTEPSADRAPAPVRIVA